MFRSGLLAFVLSLAAAVSAAAAQNAPPPRDQVSFRVEAEREVPNDWLAATLGVDEEGSDAAELAARVNKRMAAALELSQQQAELQVSSGAYQTQPVYDRSKIVRWRASQDLVIEGANVDRLTEHVGRLQAQGLLLRGVAFSVAPETRKRVEEELIVEALSSFRERAGMIARGLGRRGWNLMSLTIGESGLPQPPVPYGRAMAMEAADASLPPALASGKSTLRIAIDGTVEVE
jgi:predicted secreted protein